MRIRDYIILGLIITWLVLVAIKTIKHQKQGACASCSHCDSCIYKSSGKGCTKATPIPDNCEIQ